MTATTVANIQVLRAVAASLVVIHHLQPGINGSFATQWDSHAGAFGVDIFFVISGFIMFHTSRDGRGTLEFFANRILRIVPLYWIATACLVAVYLAGFHPNGVHHLTAGMVIKSLLFVKSTFPDGRVDLVLAPGWTLIHELNFYAIFAMTLVFRSPVTRLAAVSSVVLATLLVRLAWGPFPAVLESYYSTLAFEFSFGAVLAILCRTQLAEAAAPRSLAGSLIGAGIVVAWVLAPLQADATLSDFRFLYFGLPACAIVGGAVLFEADGCRVKSPVLLLLGAASYALYLFHPLLLQPLVRVLARLLPVGEWPGIIAAGGVLSVTLCGAVAIHLLLEQRILLAGRRWLRAMRLGEAGARRHVERHAQPSAG